jgi:hypothetical protein
MTNCEQSRTATTYTACTARLANMDFRFQFPMSLSRIEWINEYHDKGALLRYDFENPRALPMCETLFPIVEAILVATK